MLFYDTQYRLKDYCLVGDGAHASIRREESGVMYLTSKNFKNDGLNLSKIDFISWADYEKHFKKSRGALVQPTPGDIVFGIIGTIGTPYIVKENDLFGLSSSVGILRPTEEVDCRFLYYYMTSSPFQLAVEGMKGGSAQGFLSLEMIKNLPLLKPEILVQKKIAAVLSAYDELIEVNNRRIALLEKMAEELYREWFVRMRFPGHQKTKFNKGIPEGWEVRCFRDLISYYIGGGWGEENQSIGFGVRAHVVRGTDIPSLNAGEYSVGVSRYHKESNFKSRKLIPGDMVFEVSGGSTNQLLGRSVLITEGILEFLDQEVICASFCKLMRVNAELISPLFLKYFLKLYYDSDLVGIYQVQSTGISNYQFESFLSYQTVITPPLEIVMKFDNFVAPLLEEKDVLAVANVNLKNSRARLLSRLISGKLSVEELEISFPPGMEE